MYKLINKLRIQVNISRLLILALIVWNITLTCLVYSAKQQPIILIDDTTGTAVTQLR